MTQSEVADDLLAEMRSFHRPRGGRCDLCRLMEGMTPEHLAAVRAGMAAPDSTDKAVADWITSKGYEWTIKDTMSCVRHHRQMRHE